MNHILSGYYPELKIERTDLTTKSETSGITEEKSLSPPSLPPRTTSVPINLSFLFHYRNDVTARFIKLFRPKVSGILIKLASNARMYLPRLSRNSECFSVTLQFTSQTREIFRQICDKATSNHLIFQAQDFRTRFICDNIRQIIQSPNYR
jgi:hypothetical protein